MIPCYDVQGTNYEIYLHYLTTYTIFISCVLYKIGVGIYCYMMVQLYILMEIQNMTE